MDLAISVSLFTICKYIFNDTNIIVGCIWVLICKVLGNLSIAISLTVSFRPVFSIWKLVSWSGGSLGLTGSHVEMPKTGSIEERFLGSTVPLIYFKVKRKV